MRRGLGLILALGGCAGTAPETDTATPPDEPPESAASPAPAPAPGDPGAPRAETADSPTTAAPVTSAGDVLASAADFLALAVPHVEAASGAAFRAPPTVSLLSEEDAAVPFLDDLRPEVERRYPQATEGQRETMLRIAAANAARSCVARYSVSAKTIVLVRPAFERQLASLDVPAGRLLLAALCHEAVHALDDQRFDLAKVYRGAKDDESLRARAMLVEGRATHFGRAAAARLGVPPGDDSIFLPGGREVKGEREWLLHMTYSLGEQFVASRGADASERAMASPPDLTWHLCVPSRWPDAPTDPRPAEVFAAAGFDTPPKPVSDLQLRVRYAAIDGAEEAEILLAGYRGGVQVFDGSTNAAVLAFADEASATAFEQRIVVLGSPVTREGTLVVRAEGADATAILNRLVAAARKR